MSGRAYGTYWERKRLLAGPVPHFPLRRWWPDQGLCDIEQVYFEAVKGATRLLDVGAGDLRIMKKFQAAGFTGEYHTQDIGTEYAYTFADLSEVTSQYGAIICLDVIEHLPLEPGLDLIARMSDLLAPGGVLILQTPNGRCVRNPLGWDMTHVQLYNLTDLWAFARTLGLDAAGFRVEFQSGARRSLWNRFKGSLGKFVITWSLGADYADNIALIARKPPGGAV